MDTDTRFVKIKEFSYLSHPLTSPSVRDASPLPVAIVPNAVAASTLRANGRCECALAKLPLLPTPPRPPLSPTPPRPPLSPTPSRPPLSPTPLSLLTGQSSLISIKFVIAPLLSFTLTSISTFTGRLWLMASLMLSCEPRSPPSRIHPCSIWSMLRGSLVAGAVQTSTSYSSRRSVSTLREGRGAARATTISWAPYRMLTPCRPLSCLRRVLIMLLKRRGSRTRIVRSSDASGGLCNNLLLIISRSTGKGFMPSRKITARDMAPVLSC